MSRIGYSEDEDYPGQFGLWQANCDRSLQGKAGQAILRELEQALLALPEKRLIAGKLEDEEGAVCAVGALKKFKGVPEIKSNPDNDMEDVGVELGMPRLVAWKVVCLNDIEISGNDLVWTAGPYRWPAERPHLYIPVTPETRYEKVLAWVREQIATPEQPSPNAEASA